MAFWRWKNFEIILKNTNMVTVRRIIFTKNGRLHMEKRKFLAIEMILSSKKFRTRSKFPQLSTENEKMIGHLRIVQIPFFRDLRHMFSAEA